MRKSASSDMSQGGNLFIDRGGSSWVFRGRVAGKPVRKVLLAPVTGEIATVENTSKTEARKLIAQMKGDAASGGTKHFAHVAANPKAGDRTVDQVWRLYMEREGKSLRPRTKERKDSNYRRFIEPHWKDRTMRSITIDDCLRLLSDLRQGYEARGEQGTMVNVVRADLGALFKWAMLRYELGIRSNPTRDIPRQVKEQPKKPRALTERELVWFFKAAAKFVTTPPTAQGLKRSAKSPETRKRAVEATELLLRTACRRNEVFTAKWGWLSESGLMIPSGSAKMGMPILIHLTPDMRALIGARPKTAKDTDPIFSASASWLGRAIESIRPIMTELAQEEGLNGAFEEDSDPLHFSLHSLARDTFNTRMREPHTKDDRPMFGLDVRNAVLNHRNGSDVGNKHYDAELEDPRWEFRARKAAIIFWNDWLNRLKAEALTPTALAA